MTAYDLLRFIHVLFAVTALGATVTYNVWLAHAAREPEHLDFALRGIMLLEARIATPSFLMLLVTGVALLLQGPVSWRASWLVAATALYAVATLVGMLWSAPLVRALVVSLRRTGLASDDYRTLEQRMKATGSAILIAILAVLYLMVTKPQLW